MTRILGYADQVSVAPGEQLKIKVSCDDIDQYEAELIRVIHGDINPDGPGYRDQAIDVDLGGPFKGRHQEIKTGSYAMITNSPKFDANSSLGIQALIWPTLPGNGVQTILCQEDPENGVGYRLYVDASGAVGFEVSLENHTRDCISTDITLVPNRWYLISASYDAKSKNIVVSQQSMKPFPKVEDSGLNRKKSTASNRYVAGQGSIFIAARPDTNESTTENFNGRIECPRIYSRSLSAQEMVSFSDNNSNQLIAAWDFSIGIPTDQIHDTSINGLHGQLINLPTRGVAGHNWNGDEHCWTQKPEHYAAIHFHDDDLYDCAWQTDFEITMPDNIPSAVYAVHLYGHGEEFFIPFSVRPPRNKITSPIAFILPTASYMAYANNRIGIDVPETETVCGRLIQLNPIDLFMQEHPELGLCFYDVHNDNSGVFYSSRLRPMVNMQPKHIGHLGGFGSNVWQFNADTHILNWLEHIDQPFDVLTDEDLEAEGVDVLKDYKAVITGTHPEYYSEGMLDAVQGYLDDDGRLMYLGGNGFYWRVSFHPSLPGVIECRKSEDGIRAFAPSPGEFYSSFTGEYSGLWRRNGRPPNSMVGIGMVSQGFDYSAPYEMTDESTNPRAAFIFDGVQGPVIGDYGLSGGGAAGLELDATDHLLGTPPHTLVLASSERHSDLYLVTPEDMDDPAPGLGGTEAEIIRAQMVFFETANSGAVFSTGSIAWAGSLSHNQYQNDVSKITANVLERFLDEKSFNE